MFVGKKEDNCPQQNKESRGRKLEYFEESLICLDMFDCDYDCCLHMQIDIMYQCVALINATIGYDNQAHTRLIFYCSISLFKLLF